MAAGGKAPRDIGIVDPPMSQDIFPCHRQRRLRCLETVIVGERLLDQVIERLGMKQGPPVRGNATSIGKALGFAAGEIRTASGSRQRCGCVILDIWTSRSYKVGANCATG